jgi:hypothetical protein
MSSAALAVLAFPVVITSNKETYPVTVQAYPLELVEYDANQNS